MKSAYELAMSRFEQTAPSRPLTPEQKEKLREIDSEIDAKIAERRIFLGGEITKAARDLMTADSLRKQLASEIATLEEKRESLKETVRSSAGS